MNEIFKSSTNEISETLKHIFGCQNVSTDQKYVESLKSTYNSSLTSG